MGHERHVAGERAWRRQEGGVQRQVRIQQANAIGAEQAHRIATGDLQATGLQGCPFGDERHAEVVGSAGAKLRVFELNPDLVSFAREVPVETPPQFTEGVFMHVRDGRYYLSYSHGSWQHHLH